MFVRKLIAYFEGFTSSNLSISGKGSVKITEPKEDKKSTYKESISNDGITEKPTETSPVKQNLSVIQPVAMMFPTLHMLFQLAGIFPFQNPHDAMYSSCIRRVDGKSIIKSPMCMYRTTILAAERIEVLKSVLDNILAARQTLIPPETIKEPERENAITRSSGTKIPERISRLLGPAENIRNFIRSSDDNVKNCSKTYVQEKYDTKSIQPENHKSESIDKRVKDDMAVKKESSEKNANLLSREDGAEHSVSTDALKNVESTSTETKKSKVSTAKKMDAQSAKQSRAQFSQLLEKIYSQHLRAVAQNSDTNEAIEYKESAVEPQKEITSKQADIDNVSKTASVNREKDIGKDDNTQCVTQVVSTKRKKQQKFNSEPNLASVKLSSSKQSDNVSQPLNDKENINQIVEKKEQKTSFGKCVGCFRCTYSLKVKNSTIIVKDTPADPLVTSAEKSNSVLRTLEEKSVSEKILNRKDTQKANGDEKYQSLSLQETVPDGNYSDFLSFDINPSIYKQFMMTKSLPAVSENIQWKSDLLPNSMVNEKVKDVKPTIEGEDGAVPKKAEESSKISNYQKRKQKLDFFRRQDEKKAKKEPIRFLSYTEISPCDSLTDSMEPKSNERKRLKTKRFLQRASQAVQTVKSKPKLVNASTNTNIVLCDKSIMTDVCPYCKCHVPETQITASSMSAAKKQKDDLMCQSPNTKDLSCHFLKDGNSGSCKHFGKRIRDLFGEQSCINKNKQRACHKKESEEFRKYILNRYMNTKKEIKSENEKSNSEHQPQTQTIDLD